MHVIGTRVELFFKQKQDEEKSTLVPLNVTIFFNAVKKHPISGDKNGK